MGRGFLVGVEYTGVEVVGLLNQVACWGGRIWARSKKPTREGSVFTNDVWGASDLGSGILVGVGYAGVQVLGPRNHAAHKGGDVLG